MPSPALSAWYMRKITGRRVRGGSARRARPGPRAAQAHLHCNPRLQVISSAVLRTVQLRTGVVSRFGERYSRLVGKLYVVGSINIDIVVRPQRLPLRGQTVAASTLSYLPGGKGANQAVAAAKMGCTTFLIGRVGNDQWGLILREFLEDQGVDTTSVRQSNTTTGTALIIVDEFGENAIVAINGANAEVDPTDIMQLHCESGDVVVAQFEVPRDTVIAALSQAHKTAATTMLNPSPPGPVPPDLMALVDILVVNETELGLITQTSISENAGATELTRAVRKLDRQGGKITVVTRGRNGAMAFVDGDAILVPGRMVATFDTTGAGDCFTGTFAACIAAGAALEGALQTANIAASLSIQREGAGSSMPLRAEVEAVSDLGAVERYGIGGSSLC